METKEYFEKVMQDFNQNRKGRNLRKYCNDEGIDYKWLSEYKRTYGATKTASATKNKIGFVSPVRRNEAPDRCTAASNVN